MSNRRTLTLRGPIHDEPPKAALPDCPNPKCIADHKKWPPGNHIHVPEIHECRASHIPGSFARCGNCGGYWDGQKWTHRCMRCLKDVGQNELHGMWVRHSCKECEDKDIAEQRARDAVCRTCRNVFSYCYC